MENPINFMKRGRRKSATTREQLIESAQQARTEAASLPSGPTRSALLRKARKAEVTAHLNGWLTSPGLRPPE